MATIQNKPSAHNSQDFMRIQDLFYLCLNKWYWFIASLGICLGVAVYYLLTTPPVYVRTASILIKDDSKGGGSTGMEAFADLGTFTVATNVNNEMATLRSPDVMREVVSRLHLDVDYHVEGRYHKQTIYGNELPVRVSFVDLPADESAAFLLRLSGDGAVRLSSFVHNGEEMDVKSDVTGTLSDSIASPLGTIVIAPSSVYTADTEMAIHVSRTPLAAVASGCVSRLAVSRADASTNIISLSYQDVSPQRAEDLLNMLITVYNENWLKDKNQLAVSTSMFINERLGVIENELGHVDDDISTYKSEHLLPDVQAAASMYMARANAAETSVKELKDQVYMARYVKSYLTNEENMFKLLPTNSGMESTNISAQISEYNNQLQERNNLVAHSSTKNPLVVEMDASLTDLRKALISSIDNQLVALNAQIKSHQAIGGQATSQIASNPKQSKYLLSVERQQKVKESLYIYLLQKREENELSQAFTAYNTRVITRPGGSMAPIAPVKKSILLVAFAVGMLLPIVIIFLHETMNTKLRGRKDLEGMTIPFIGEIPLAFSRKRKWYTLRKEETGGKIVVKEKSRNIINEAFRVVRTNLEFMMGKERESNVIMLTSANPGSGKTFITFNLATSFAVKGKRVLVIDLDLRKGSLSRYVGSPATGIADYLAEQINCIDDIICTPSEHLKLDVIPVGTIPPNPTELLFSERLEKVIGDFRKEYDYIFIDCPPVEIVADAAIINKLADMTLFILRAGLLERNMLPEIEQFYTDKKYKNMSILLNGTDGGGRYGYKYGYKYGYHYGYAGYAKDE